MSDLGLECHCCWQGITVRTLVYAGVPLTPSGVVYARSKSRCQGKAEGASREYTTEERGKERKMKYTNTNNQKTSPLKDREGIDTKSDFTVNRDDPDIEELTFSPYKHFSLKLKHVPTIFLFRIYRERNLNPCIYTEFCSNLQKHRPSLLDKASGKYTLKQLPLLNCADLHVTFRFRIGTCLWFELQNSFKQKRNLF